jgi:hypothetical protein
MPARAPLRVGKDPLNDAPRRFRSFLNHLAAELATVKLTTDAPGFLRAAHHLASVRGRPWLAHGEDTELQFVKRFAAELVAEEMAALRAEKWLLRHRKRRT